MLAAASVRAWTIGSSSSDSAWPILTVVRGLALGVAALVSRLLRVVAFAATAGVLFVRAASVATAILSESWLSLVSRIVGAFDRLAVRTRHIGRLVALLAFDDIEHDTLVLAKTLLVFVRVIFDDGTLVNKNVLFGLITSNRGEE